MDKLLSFDSHPALQSPRYSPVRLSGLGILVFVLLFLLLQSQLGWESEASSTVPIHAEETLQKCRSLNVKPGSPSDFNQRTQSDRFAAGTHPTLIRNATVWTGSVNGLEILKADILLDKGLIKSVGNIKQNDLAAYKDLVILEAAGAWVTPGLVDLHSHVGILSFPILQGSNDVNSFKGPILPWLRSLDGLNTHDDSYRLSISGGVTTALVLPGSANAIGGQAFSIKLRPTKEHTTTSMLLEPPYSLNGSEIDPSLPPRWRQMKHACGENPSKVYSGTRMDTIWALRQGYDTARKIKASQDEYCSKALAGRWTGLGLFPEDLQWEALVDVLRGRVKVHVHCYEAVDLDAFVRLSNEFKFSVAAFHHAHEAFLVPDLLKKAYGHPPAVALFSMNARYKREAYRGSEFAPRILADEGLQVVIKSDHPAVNSRLLLYEAQQAHYYGLDDNLALTAVTTTPAIIMGQDHRIGYIKEGYDADIVVWDSHPLALGATPKQVYIDGVPQFAHPYIVDKPDALQSVPRTPNFDNETAAAIEYEGLPPLAIENANSGLVIFSNVSSVFLRDGKAIQEVFSATKLGSGVVVVDSGTVTCVGISTTCLKTVSQNAEYVNLEGGSVSPALISFGSPLGLQDIRLDESTHDGYVLDPFQIPVPDIVGGGFSVVRAADGLQFSGRDALLAYRAGVTSGVVSPASNGFFSGLGTAFSTSAAHKLEKNALIQEVTALHIHVGHLETSKPSISTQISTLRRLLLGNGFGDLGRRFQDVVDGKLPLVIEVYNADAMASLIILKAEVETKTGKTIRMAFTGASEAYLLAKEISSAHIGVILRPFKPFPTAWESRRILPGPPLTQQTTLSALLAENVLVGIGIEETWSVDIRFDIAWAALEADVNITKAQALALASVNLETLLGLNTAQTDLVVTRGGSLLDFESKIVGVISPARGVVDIF